MIVKRMRRKCGMRGCRNVDTYTFSRTSETGNSVILCRECLEMALEAVKGCTDKPKKKNPDITAGDAPKLFSEKNASKKAAPKRGTKKAGVE